MKLPEPLFVIINPVVRILLRSPLHGLISDSLMLVTFRGRQSGRLFTTPVRYIRIQETICCFTATTNKWWRNMRDGAEVTLTVAGCQGRYKARAVLGEPKPIRDGLLLLLERFPQDAPYYGIRLTVGGKPMPEDLERAIENTVMVEARFLGSATL